MARALVTRQNIFQYDINDMFLMDEELYSLERGQKKLAMGRPIS